MDATTAARVHALAILLPVSAARARELKALPYAEYLRQPEWRRRVRAKLAEARSALPALQRRAARSAALHVHHRTYQRLGNELRGDLVVLCSDCHDAFHRFRRLPVSRFSRTG